jgi:hypothetical protein
MKYVLLFCFILVSSINAKVLLISHSFNRPDFIELHVKTFKAFLQDDYQYVVFNDAPGENMKKQIEEMCSKHSIRCIRMPQELHSRPHDPGARHIDGIKYAFEKIGFDFDGIVTLVDSDVFLLKPFSIEKYLKGYDIAAELQGRTNGKIEVRYLSPIFLMMNMNTLPNKTTLNMSGAWIEGLPCDVGGHTYFYLKNNPTVKPRIFTLLHMPAVRRALDCQNCKDFSCPLCIQYLKYVGCDDAMIQFINDCPDDNMEFGLNNTFFHYRSGSNWNNKPGDYHTTKTNALNDYINNILTRK